MSISGVTPFGYDFSQIRSTISSPGRCFLAISAYASRRQRRTETCGVVQRTAPERRKSRTEDRPRIDEIGVGDDAVRERGLRFGDHRPDKAIDESLRRRAGCGLGRLAARPVIETTTALAAEISGRDER